MLEIYINHTHTHTQTIYIQNIYITHRYRYTCVYTHTQVHTQAHTHTHTHRDAHSHTLTHSHTHTPTHSHPHTHTHTHTHTPTPTLNTPYLKIRELVSIHKLAHSNLPLERVHTSHTNNLQRNSPPHTSHHIPSHRATQHYTAHHITSHYCASTHFFPRFRSELHCQHKGRRQHVRTAKQHLLKLLKVARRSLQQKGAQQTLDKIRTSFRCTSTTILLFTKCKFCCSDITLRSISNLLMRTLPLLVKTPIGKELSDHSS